MTRLTGFHTFMVCLLIGVAIIIVFGSQTERVNSQKKYDCVQTRLITGGIHPEIEGGRGVYYYVTCKLPDNRTIECITFYEMGAGGLSCNWKEVLK